MFCKTIIMKNKTIYKNVNFFINFIDKLTEHNTIHDTHT